MITIGNDMFGTLCKQARVLICGFVLLVAVCAGCSSRQQSLSSWCTKGIPKPELAASVSDLLVCPVAETNVLRAVAMLECEVAVQLSLKEAQELLDKPSFDPDARLDRLVKTLEEAGSFLQAETYRKMKGTLHPYLVRCVSTSGYRGIYEVDEKDGRLWILSGTMGNKETREDLKRYPLVVCLRTRPNMVYVDTYIIE